MITGRGLRAAIFSIGSFVGLLATGRQAVGAPAYTIVDLGVGRAYAINDARQVTGLAGSNSFQAFIYNANGVKTVFGASFFRQFSRGWAINQLGVISGSAYNDATGNGGTGFTWANGSGAPIPLEHGYSINDGGTVVGTRPNGSIVNAATYFNGVVTDLGTFGGNSSIPWGINNAGKVVGRARDTGGVDRAFVYQNGALNSLSLVESIAQDINNVDQIVGVRKLPSGAKHATLWQNGTTTDLDTLNTPDSYAYAINEAGTVVGYAGFAFIWHDGQMEYLNGMIDPALGWTLYNALDINNKGQIVGYGTINNQEHAYVLTPTPEPSSCGVLAMSSLWLCRRGHRGR